MIIYLNQLHLYAYQPDAGNQCRDSRNADQIVQSLCSVQISQTCLLEINALIGKDNQHSSKKHRAPKFGKNHSNRLGSSSTKRRLINSIHFNRLILALCVAIFQFEFLLSIVTFAFTLYSFM